MFGIRYNGYQEWGTDYVETVAAGTAFINLNNQPCDEVCIFNPASGVSLDVLAAKTPLSLDKFVTVDAPSGTVIPVTGNANEILVRRTDLSATPTTVRYIWRRYRR